MRAGGLYRQPDVLDPASSYFVILVAEDPRGPVRVHERSRIRDVAQRLVDNHPLSLSPALAFARCALRLQTASRRSCPSGAASTTIPSFSARTPWLPASRP